MADRPRNGPGKNLPDTARPRSPNQRRDQNRPRSGRSSFHRINVASVAATSTPRSDCEDSEAINIVDAARQRAAAAGRSGAAQALVRGIAGLPHSTDRRTVCLVGRAAAPNREVGADPRDGECSGTTYGDDRHADLQRGDDDSGRLREAARHRANCAGTIGESQDAHRHCARWVLP